jgi:hypothetical protein
VKPSAETIPDSPPVRSKRPKARVIGQKVVSRDFAVTTVSMNDGGFRKNPCPECPWRKDVPTGVFPADAFRTSANTACDASVRIFACHMSGTEAPLACAGFLLQNADNNIAVRIASSMGRFDPDQVSSRAPLYDNYREMAIANGVDSDDASLADCRGNGEPFRPRTDGSYTR